MLRVDWQLIRHSTSIDLALGTRGCIGPAAVELNNCRFGAAIVRMNFTFVTHKGARPEKTELVKSHVMREAQKKRREAKQRRNRTKILPARQ